MFGNTSVGDNVQYSFKTIQFGQEKVLDSGDGISASGRSDKVLQGGFTITLYNDNLKDGIDVNVKVIAVQVEKTWADKQYTEEKVTPRYEKKIFKDPVITTAKIPVAVQ